MVFGHPDDPSDSSLSDESLESDGGSEFRERTTGDTIILVSVLFLSTCISGYGLWTLIKFLNVKFF